MNRALTAGAERATALCESLWDSVSLGPGVQNALFAKHEVRGCIERLHTEIPGNDVRCKLLEIEALFEKWFSDRDWRGYDQGRSFQHDLYSKIKVLRTNVRLWYSFAGKSDAGALQATRSTPAQED
jgi:hypothetical protein